MPPSCWLGTKTLKDCLPILATLLVFACLAIDSALFRPPTELADDYHAAVADAARQLPRHHGDWLGVDAPVPAGAVKLLNANAIVSRRFENFRTGETLTFVLVHVRDARDILGHYPPICYPGQGWVMEAAGPVDWQSPAADTRSVLGTEYRFRQELLGGSATLSVDNFLLLPDGTTCRNMDEVESAAMDRLRKVYGAAQIQLVYQGELAAERRAQITGEFIRYAAPVMAAIRTGQSVEK